MLNIETINKEILDLENHDTTYATCEKLAWLYIVKDHLAMPEAREMVPNMSGSEFIEACTGKDVGGLLHILNEHMEVIQLMHPREYAAVITKIRNL